MSEQQHDKLPELHILNPRTATFENVMEMFRRLTGREPTAEAVEEAEREWEQDGDGQNEMAKRHL
jgi:hypothetical protein